MYWLAIPVKNTFSYQPNPIVAGIDNGGIFSSEYYLLNNDGNVIIKTVTGTNYDFTAGQFPTVIFTFR